MIVALISWGLIAICAFLCGFVGLYLLYGKKKMTWGIDVCILSGLCVLTVYAQMFSLFYKVGGIAVGILAAICLVIALILRKDIVTYIRMNTKTIRSWQVVLAAVLFVLVLALTVRGVAHYDTDLYHAQSIRWIEEFGVVKGLGNLHNRFAYNSAFFCLQALFSFKFVLNRSLHTMNGFVVAILVVWAATSLNIFHKRKIVTSDLFKLCQIFYIVFTEAVYVISSPGSDILALSLVLYIGAKWCELFENSNESLEDHGILCLLAVWAATVKLSAGALVFLAVYPAVKLIRGRQWKLTGVLIGSGLLILLPFLVRNIVISGYLVYPYASIDVFSVDWKMAESVVQDDAREIAAWGRGMTSRAQYDAPFGTWFPIWYGRLGTQFRILFWGSIAGILGSIPYAISSLKRKNGWQRLNLLLVNMTGLLLWFWGAPLTRYGVIYLLLLPVMFVGIFLEKIKWTLPGNISGSLILAYSLICLALFVKGTGKAPVKWPEDYAYREVAVTEMDGLTFYLGAESDQVGYHYFPSTPNQARLDNIELRTGNLEDGFRVKEELRNCNIVTDGYIAEE